MASKLPLTNPPSLEENIGIIAVNLPLVRSFSNMTIPTLRSGYTKLRDTVGRKLYGSTDNSSIEKNIGRHSEDTDVTDSQRWGLRAPGSQTMKTITLSHVRSRPDLDGDVGRDQGLGGCSNMRDMRRPETMV